MDELALIFEPLSRRFSLLSDCQRGIVQASCALSFLVNGVLMVAVSLGYIEQSGWWVLIIWPLLALPVVLIWKLKP